MPTEGGRALRLDEKPYPGEPITVGQIIDKDLLFGRHFEVCVAVPRSAPEVISRMMPEVALGYDFACPDWRERLGRVRQRIADKRAEVALPDLLHSCAALGLAMADQFIREEFGIEEA